MVAICGSGLNGNCTTGIGVPSYNHRAVCYDYDMNVPTSVNLKRTLIEAAVVALLVLIVFLLTSPLLPMTWDEGNAIKRASLILSEGKYQYTNQEEGHPSLYGIVIAVGSTISPPWLDPLTQWRFGPMLLMAVAFGLMYLRLRRDISLTAAIGAVVALMLIPRLFAHSHFASFDGPLTACWIIAWSVFPIRKLLCTPREEVYGGRRLLEASLRRKQIMSRLLRTTLLAACWGVALALPMSCKSTGWLAMIPFVVWMIWVRPRRWPTWLVVVPISAVCAFVVFNPSIWMHPIAGLTEFFKLNFFRGENPELELNISTWFLGQMYDLHHPLPWYNTIFWTAVTVPVVILALAAVAMTELWRGDFFRRRFVLFVVFNWLILLIVRAIPGTPVHDGVRLFLPSFVFLAILAGIGGNTVVGWLLLHRRRRGAFGRSNRDVRLPRIIIAGALLLALVSCAADMFVYRPYWLSYYNRLIGGLPGAVRAGMEPTYYWDSLDKEIEAWLTENTAANERILFSSISPENLELKRKWGELPRATGQVNHANPDPGAGTYRWYVMQHRRSAMYAHDIWLVKNVKPKFRLTFLNVIMLDIYEAEDYRRALYAAAGKKMPTEG